KREGKFNAFLLQNKEKHKKGDRIMTPPLFLNNKILYLFCNKSLISVSRSSSFEGSGGAAASSFSCVRLRLLISFMTKNIQNAIIKNCTTTLIKTPKLIATSAISFSGSPSWITYLISEKSIPPVM